MQPPFLQGEGCFVGGAAVTVVPFPRPQKGDCPECGSYGWRRYYSETTDGNLEEAFELCPCNHKPETAGKRTREESECPETVAGDLASSLDRDTQSLI